MPLCARCTGIYVGVLLAFCFLLLKKRMDAGRPFSKGQAMLTALMILPIGMDGLGSYFGFWESNQLMRVLSGSLVGALSPGFCCWRSILTLHRVTNSRFMRIQRSCFCFCCFPQGLALVCGLVCRLQACLRLLLFWGKFCFGAALPGCF